MLRDSINSRPFPLLYFTYKIDRRFGKFIFTNIIKKKKKKHLVSKDEKRKDISSPFHEDENAFCTLETRSFAPLIHGARNNGINKQ